MWRASEIDILYVHTSSVCMYVAILYQHREHGQIYLLNQQSERASPFINILIGALNHSHYPIRPLPLCGVAIAGQMNLAVVLRIVSSGTRTGDLFTNHYIYMHVCVYVHPTPLNPVLYTHLHTYMYVCRGVYCMYSTLVRSFVRWLARSLIYECNRRCEMIQFLLFCQCWQLFYIFHWITGTICARLRKFCACF